jgi:hypothetical protein
MMETNSAYYRRRAIEEKTAALASAHPKVRQVHIDLARRYDDLVAGNPQRDRNPLLGLIAS